MSAPRIYFEDDFVTLWHGRWQDVVELVDVEIAHCIADAPYDDHTHARGGRIKRKDGGVSLDALSFEALQPGEVEELSGFAAEFVKRWTLIFTADRKIEHWSSALEDAGAEFARVACWVKPDGSPQFSGDRPGHAWEPIVVAHSSSQAMRWNGRGHKGVFRTDAHELIRDGWAPCGECGTLRCFPAVYEHNRNEVKGASLHPTQKPLALMQELVALFTDEGEAVLDPYAGSGTTGLAARNLGRRAILIEKDEAHCAIAVKRLAQEVLPFVRAQKPTQSALFEAAGEKR